MAWPEPEVRVRLVEAAEELMAPAEGAPAGAAATSTPPDLVVRIQEALKQSPPDVEAERHLLACALDSLYSELDFGFWQEVNRYSKGMWLAGSALLLILAVAFFVGNPVFLLVGAVGGFISRLGRALNADKEGAASPEFNSFWTTLFISPLMGALTGWAGVLLVSLGLELDLLGRGLQEVHIVPGDPTRGAGPRVHLRLLGALL